jgi:transposase InsO family protein
MDGAAEWLARQITEAFPWASVPVYLVRDNDRAYRQIFAARVRAMGIRDRPISPGSPWQNGIAERLIGHASPRVPGSDGAGMHHTYRG